MEKPEILNVSVISRRASSQDFQVLGNGKTYSGITHCRKELRTTQVRWSCTSPESKREYIWRCWVVTDFETILSPLTGWGDCGRFLMTRSRQTLHSSLRRTKKSTDHSSSSQPWEGYGADHHGSHHHTYKQRGDDWTKTQFLRGSRILSFSTQP